MLRVEIFFPMSIDLEKLEQELRDTNVVSIAASEVRLFGDTVKSHDMYRGVERAIRHAQKIKVEIVTPKQSLPIVLKKLKEVVDEKQLSAIKLFTSEMQDLQSLQNEVMH